MTRDSRDRRSNNPKSSVNQPMKKSGGGGKYSVGKAGDERNQADMDYYDPAYDPDERRQDPEDGYYYTWDELAAYYKGKYKLDALNEYWKHECTPEKSKPKKKTKAKFADGPTPNESAKYRVKEKAEKKGQRLTDEDMASDGPLARECAAVIPYFPFKKLDRFYDVQGILAKPKLFNAMCAVFARRYSKMGVTKILGFEARGFLFTPIAIKLGVPFVMLRKAGKMPNTISSAPYTKEYEGLDTMSIQKGSVVEGDKVVLIDDLVATGGTLISGLELVKACGGEVVECGCMVELKALKGRERVIKAGAKDVFGFISEDLLTLKADLPDDYVDDGKK
eukprot:TRINITY_DN26939_c0_g1_i1.p1 TRINITY_DN26939_c0_g1~~TRINITY_DN26939_c0_g1_i1.p1  ORF type:complete len:363 (-),score=77.49 TRINITY_DN26939_c0_g1_i1:171-1175(-)